MVAVAADRQQRRRHPDIVDLVTAPMKGWDFPLAMGWSVSCSRAAHMEADAIVFVGVSMSFFERPNARDLLIE
jgi:hypothetical protein